MSRSKITRFVERLDKIGIKVTLMGNFPWIYLSTINGKPVTEKRDANHGYNIAFEGTKPGHPAYKFTDIHKTFVLIRKYVTTNQE